MLRFKTDENLPVEIADLLTDAGYEAETVWSEHIHGSSDKELLELCQVENRIMVTLEMDFSDIRFTGKRTKAGSRSPTATFLQ